MSQGDWLLIGSVVLFTGPYLAGLIYLAVIQYKTDRKDEV